MPPIFSSLGAGSMRTYGILSALRSLPRPSFAQIDYLIIAGGGGGGRDLGGGGGAGGLKIGRAHV